MNKSIIIVFVILLTFIGAYLVFKTPVKAPGEQTPSSSTTTGGGGQSNEGAIKEFTVTASEFSFDPNTITVNEGDRVRIVFRNAGSLSHNFTLEGLGVASKTIGSNRTDTLEFTAPAKGAYKFFCSVGTHRASGLEGTLEVK